MFGLCPHGLIWPLRLLILLAGWPGALVASHLFGCCAAQPSKRLSLAVVRLSLPKGYCSSHRLFAKDLGNCFGNCCWELRVATAPDNWSCELLWATAPGNSSSVFLELAALMAALGNCSGPLLSAFIFGNCPWQLVLATAPCNCSWQLLLAAALGNCS